MNYLSHPFLITLRNLGRRLGLNSLIAALISTNKYEDAFDNELISRITPGDKVWDVGANIGYYSQKFSVSAGASGSVYAFEPSPQNLLALENAVIQLGNVHIISAALGDLEQLVYFKQGKDALGATSSIVEGTIDQNTVEVKMYSGDSAIVNGLAPVPNIIKIDVEGFEYEVILGLTETLKNTALRFVGIEIHFGLLNTRSLNFAPKKIEAILQSAGFTVRWPDNSHIIAFR